MAPTTYGTRVLTLLLGATWLLAGDALAQSAPDPITGASGDSGFDPLAEPMDAAPSWIFEGDLRLRGDVVEGLPNNRDDIERLRGFLRAAAVYVGSPDFEIGIGVKLAQGSDDNDDNIPNFDNERSDDASIDRAYISWLFSDNGVLTGGKESLPLAVSPMVWDTDLRPIGASLDWRTDFGEFDRLGFTAGYFDPDHELGGDARLAALQGSWLIRPGAAHSGALRLGYLDFVELDGLIESGLGRTNARTPAGYVSDFELLTLDARYRHDQGPYPLTLRLDLVHNLGADDKSDGARFSVALGDARHRGGAEAGAIWQRIQQDAVLAAMNNDDWWFHSNARGVGLWAGYGFDDHWQLRGTFFRERRDGLEGHTRRYLIDLIYRH